MQQRILIAEPETDELAQIAACLNSKGYEIVPALTGLDALKQARAALPDLIILDATLPDIDGQDVCDILRRLPSTAPIPIIMLATWSSRLRAMPPETGPDECLTKPFAPMEVALRVNETLSRWNEIKMEREAPDRSADDEPRLRWFEG
jgi:DNA-binding response OmpR family regulator